MKYTLLSVVLTVIGIFVMGNILYNLYGITVHPTSIIQSPPPLTPSKSDSLEDEYNIHINNIFDSVDTYYLKYMKNKTDKNRKVWFNWVDSMNLYSVGMRIKIREEKRKEKKEQVNS